MAQHKRQYQGADTSAGPSAAIWGNCTPLDDETVGFVYYDHFLGPFDPTTALGYTITQEASGVLEVADGKGGWLNVSSDGHNAAHDGINAQLLSATGGENYIPAVGKDIWFEARIKVNDETDEFFVGLCDRETDIIEQTTGMLDVTARNMLAFYTDAGTTATYLEFVTAKAGSADQNTDVAGGAAIADDTFVKVGFRLWTGDDNLMRVTPYIDGTPYTVVTDTDDIPVLDMAVSYVAQVAATGANAELYIDWIRVAQLY